MKSDFKDLVVGGVAAAYGNLVPAWRGAWASLALTGLAAGLWYATVNLPPRQIHTLDWFGLMLFIGLMAKGATLRLALGRGKPGIGGVQLGRVEFQLILVALLTFAFLFVLGLLFFVVLICTGYAVASSGPGFKGAQVMTWAPAIVGNGRWVFGAVGLLGAAGMVWAATRISLGAVVTVATGKVAVLSTWPVTRGRVVSIVVAALATFALPLAVVVVPSVALRGLGELEAFRARVAEGVVLVGLWVPMGIGLMAFLVRRLA